MRAPEVEMGSERLGSAGSGLQLAWIPAEALDCERHRAGPYTAASSGLLHSSSALLPQNTEQPWGEVDGEAWAAPRETAAQPWGALSSSPMSFPTHRA